MSDVITLTGLRGFGRHGVLEHERREGQEFVVDVRMHLDTRRAALTDEVMDTVHYGEVAEQVVAIVGAEPVALIETLAARIAEGILERALIERVEVSVHKPSAPIAVPFADVCVSIVRARGSAS